MANRMVGRELTDLYPPRDIVVAADAAPAMKVHELQRARLGARRRALRCGPARSWASPAWSARAVPKLFEGLMGLQPRERSGRDARQAGARPERAGAIPAMPRSTDFSYLSEDRKGKGLHVHFGLRQNLTLMALERYAQPVVEARR
jgi:ribose transport system ATP-binding protein